MIGTLNGLLGVNSGRMRVTGVSRSSRPCSTSCMTARSVNSLETEPTRYTVSAVAGTLRAASAKPNPRAQTIR